MSVKRCKAAFAVFVNGAPIVVAGGQLVDEDHLAYKGREHLFEDVDVYMEKLAASKVEKATAAPGEKRAIPVRRGPSKKGSDA